MGSERREEIEQILYLEDSDSDISIQDNVDCGAESD